MEDEDLYNQLVTQNKAKEAVKETKKLLVLGDGCEQVVANINTIGACLTVIETFGNKAVKYYYFTVEEAIRILVEAKEKEL